MKRSICIICNGKKYQSKMVKHGQHWSCMSCVSSGNDRPINSAMAKRIRVLNLYAGVGGNRWNWPGNLEVTAVEYNAKVAAEYKRNFPHDRVIIGDAHSYLIKHFHEYDIIASSPPCQSHSKMNYIQEKKRYPDMSLYQEILLLRSFFKGKWYVENVKPYYDTLVKPDFEIARHLFWTNVPQLTNCKLPEFPIEYQGRHRGIMVMPREVICNWLGIVPGQKTIYLSSRSSEQVYRNCVHPLLGASIMTDILNSMK